jgi:hypothetical protein
MTKAATYQFTAESSFGMPRATTQGISNASIERGRMRS